MPLKKTTPSAPPLPAHVLVVEDDAVLGMALEAAVQDAGVEQVDLCTTTELALEAMRRKQPDAIVLDVHLADRDDGWAIAEMLRSLGSGSPRIIFSTGAPQEIPEDIAALGPVLAKPYEMHQLIEALREEPRPSLLARLRRRR